MVLRKPKTDLVLEHVDKPICGDEDILVKVRACGVCRTDLHILEGELPHPKLPLILGHQIVGVVEEMGKHVKGFCKDERVGIPWLGASCGECDFCEGDRENLCETARFTGYDLPGGFAEYAICRAEFAVPLPPTPSDEHIAPLLCAGLIGYRAYRKASPHKTLGLYGFGVSAHIVAQLALFEKKEVYAFTREGDLRGQEFAKEFGAIWAGSSKEMPPVLLDAAILFAPNGALVPLALKALKKGGRCICAEITMSDIPAFPYADLWGEKVIASVANLTREDARAFFALLPKTSIRTEISVYPLEKANQALADLKRGAIKGAAVINPLQII
jgi:propanol-preferring alcohol dehydrogenase